ncbi:MAG: phosphocholine cytidylyltransferase family protein [Lachnospiraceae bacterium]|nr:phosphocholine cytidylyltransferase family protein [Lachnospiraceae bacterium]
MQAIIMAAGRGSRLGNLTDDRPKSFLEVNGESLIDHNIKMLHAFGIKDIKIVTGYKNEMFEEHFKGNANIELIYNPFYEMMNVLGSFFMGMGALKDDEETVFLHADTVCDYGIFKDMLEKEGDMVLPVDFRPCDEEAMKVLTKDGEVIEISKEIDCSKGEGEFIGICKIKDSAVVRVKEAAKKLMKEKQFKEYFEGAIQELINRKQYRIITVATNGRFWGEVDTEEDLERVKQQADAL